MNNAMRLLSMATFFVAALAAADPQLDAARKLITRVVGADKAAHFTLELISPPTNNATNEEYFTLPVSLANNITIRGTNAIALASGFHWYLKYTAHCGIRYGDVKVTDAELPILPAVLKEERVESVVWWRYYMNVVTHSYSAAFWDWARWEQEIDWMAMNGVNMPLAFTGQEAIWDKVYRNFNLTQAEIDAHFAGPAFLAWGRMGNIRGWGGRYTAESGINGLTAHWIAQQKTLQLSIVQRERSLGMTTVLPAFAGHIPNGFKRLFPSAKIYGSGGWCGFAQEYSEVPVVDATDPLFVQIGKAFTTELIATYGTDHYYNGDTFNEMAAPDISLVPTWGEATYSSLSSVDPEAVWFVQGWSLRGWPDEKLQAYWSKVPEGRLLSLDLNCAVQSPGSSDKFIKNIKPPRPVICGLLTNMGGERYLGGSLAQLANNSWKYAQREGGRTGLLAGVGHNPEDLHCNPVKWQLLGEVPWRGLGAGRSHSLLVTNMSTWMMHYAARRYAPYGSSASKAQEAWAVLLKAAYTGTSDHLFADDGICRMPSFALRSGTAASKEPAGIVQALRLLVAAAEESGVATVTVDNADSNQEGGAPSGTVDAVTTDNVGATGGAVGSLTHLEQNAAFRYDVTDVSRQLLQNRFATLYQDLLRVESTCSGGAAKWTDKFDIVNGSNCIGAVLFPNKSNANMADQVCDCGYIKYRKDNCSADCLFRHCISGTSATEAKPTVHWTMPFPKIWSNDQCKQPGTSCNSGNKCADLAACQAACVVKNQQLGKGTCNAVSWNPSVGDCVLRGCPAKELLVPAWADGSYQGYALVNHSGPVATVPCTMINSNGYLFAGKQASAPYAGYPLRCYMRTKVAPNVSCTAAFANVSSAILELGQDLDRVLAADTHFLLGKWIASARAFGSKGKGSKGKGGKGGVTSDTSSETVVAAPETLVRGGAAVDSEADWLEWNARVQVTMWGTQYANGGTITDYAAKQYGGLVGGYYLPLWKDFFATVLAAYKAGNSTPAASQIRVQMVAKAEQWINSTAPASVYPETPSGESTVLLAKTMLSKYHGKL
jgi:alpha-N-acetylglucosaminidase